MIKADVGRQLVLIDNFMQVAENFFRGGNPFAGDRTEISAPIMMTSWRSGDRFIFLNWWGLIFSNQFAYPAIALGQQIQFTLGISTQAQVCTFRVGCVTVLVADNIYQVSLFTVNAYA